MPEHVHLIVYPLGPEAQVAKLLFAIKRPFSFRVKQDMSARGDPLVDRLTLRDRPGQCLAMFFSESQNGAIDLLEVDGAPGQPGTLLDRNSTSDENGGHH